MCVCGGVIACGLTDVGRRVTPRLCGVASEQGSGERKQIVPGGGKIQIRVLFFASIFPDPLCVEDQLNPRAERDERDDVTLGFDAHRPCTSSAHPLEQGPQSSTLQA